MGWCTWPEPGTDIQPEFCPDSVSQYVHSNSHQRRRSSLALKTRKHLLHLGWRIECVPYDKNCFRFRYTSPENRYSSLSLLEVCHILLNGSVQSRESSDNDGGADGFRDASSDSNDDYRGDGGGGGSDDDDHGGHGRELFVIKPGFYPEAVVYWSEKGDRKIGAQNKMYVKKAKRHLSAMRWTFRYVGKASGGRELRYISPNGKVYNSLKSACKAFIDDGGVSDQRMDEQIPLSPEETMSSSESSEEVMPARKIRRAGKDIETVVKVRGGPSKSPIRGKCRFSSTSRNQVSRSVKLNMLINNGLVSLGERVYYRKDKGPTALKEGEIATNGIRCFCCGNVFTLTGFESHAGSTRHRPAANIFLWNGKSLANCQREALRTSTSNLNDALEDDMRNEDDERIEEDIGNEDGEHVEDDEHDGVCSVCRFGGEMMLCDGCPSVYHKECLGLKEVPEGNWFCPPCCCGICGKRKLEKTDGDSLDDDDSSKFCVCHQCQRKFHRGCVRKKRKENVSLGSGWFCSDVCEGTFSGLNELAGKGIPVGVKDITWRMLGPLESSHVDLSENNNKLKAAMKVIKACFKSIKEPTTRRDIVHDVVFCRGAKLKRLDFRGFKTVVLERKGKKISAATVRVYQRVAEVPLVATKLNYRRKGMCRLLMNELENQLAGLGVETLILPSAPEMLGAWTTKFGFSRMTDSERFELLDHTFLEFNETTLCRKVLRKNPSAEWKPDSSSLARGMK